MAFTNKPQVFNAKINPITFGANGHEVTLGGSNVYPLYSFDAPIENAPKVGIEVSDKGFDATLPEMAKFYEGCSTVVEMAKRAASAEGVDFVCLRLESADPNAENTSDEECAALCKAVAEAIDKPLAVIGSKNAEKDATLLGKVAEALTGYNPLLLSFKEENYKAVAASAIMAYGAKAVGESAVDINLAKQLNVMVSQMGIAAGNTVMNIGTAAAGYGFEYVVSTMDRVRGAALTQNDKDLQMPIVTPVGDETWNVKESMLEEIDNPAWGAREERGIQMEIVTAAADLASGSDAVILHHPASVKTVSAFVAALM